ncbi:MAG: hypothetical protein MZV70_49850 [Desulfobacterales bacterium]|nr:hypothetical protein [Desulfobacterales bacterium]
MRLFENQRAGDSAVLNADDAEIRSRAGSIAAAGLAFSTPPAAGTVRAARRSGRRCGCALPGRDEARSRPRPLPPARPAQPRKRRRGRAGRAPAGRQPRRRSRRRWTSSRPPPTAWRRSRRSRGVEYVNDSKATNVDAVRRGPGELRAAGGPHHGRPGQGRATSRLLADAARAARQGARAGGRGARDDPRRTGRASCPMHEAADMDDAVRRAAAHRRARATPCCSPRAAPASTCYANYQERGEDFRRAVEPPGGRPVPPRTAKEPTPVILTPRRRRAACPPSRTATSQILFPVAVPGRHRHRHGLQRELGARREEVRLRLLLPEKAGRVRADRHLRAWSACRHIPYTGLPAARLPAAGARRPAAGRGAALARSGVTAGGRAAGCAWGRFGSSRPSSRAWR